MGDEIFFGSLVFNCEWVQVVLECKGVVVQFNISVSEVKFSIVVFVDGVVLCYVGLIWIVGSCFFIFVILFIFVLEWGCLVVDDDLCLVGCVNMFVFGDFLV